MVGDDKERTPSAIGDTLSAHHYLLEFLLCHVAIILPKDEETGESGVLVTLKHDIETAQLSPGAKEVARAVLKSAQLSLKAAIDEARGRRPQ
jgi:hypothetical protein